MLLSLVVLTAYQWNSLLKSSHNLAGQIYLCAALVKASTKREAASSFWILWNLEMQKDKLSQPSYQWKPVLHEFSWSDVDKHITEDRLIMVDQSNQRRLQVQWNFWLFTATWMTPRHLPLKGSAPAWVTTAIPTPFASILASPTGVFLANCCHGLYYHSSEAL